MLQKLLDYMGGEGGEGSELIKSEFLLNLLVFKSDLACRPWNLELSTCFLLQ